MRPTLLFIGHSWGGGAIRYVRELAAHVASQAEVVFAWGVEDRTLHLSRRDPELADRTFDLALGLEPPLRELSQLGIARVDVLVNIGLRAHLDTLLARLGVPYDATLLGYESFASDAHLAGSDGRFIGDAAVDSLAASFRASNSVPLFLKRAERRIACSRDLAQSLKKFIPELPVIAARFPERSRPEKVVPRLVPRAPGESLRVLVLGRLAKHKGLATLCEIAEIAERTDFPCELFCLGEKQVEEIPEILRRSKRVNLLGSYAQEELEAIVSRVRPHLAWLPLPAIETHSFALSDVMALGLPLLATGLGALPERVHGRSLTWLVPFEQADGAGFFRWLVRLANENLATPPRWLPISHLPPLVSGFYERKYLAPVLPPKRGFARWLGRLWR